jgi:ABC-type siderophore export system fused ATPase/permease subunit
MALHFVIQFSSLAVSIYLGVTLTTRFGAESSDDSAFIKTLLALILVAIVSNTVGKLISNKIFLSISQNLHDKMVKSVIRTSVVYFEENTSGSIMNRFSKDVKCLDYYLFCFIECTDYGVKCLFSTLILCYLFPPLILLAGF